MMIRFGEHCQKGVTDGQTEIAILKAAWSQLKNNQNRHIKHENLLSIYENMNYFQIMLLIVTC